MASWKKIISEDTSGVASISSKLGVGISSPNHTLHVKGSGNTNQSLFLITDSDDNNQFRIDNSSADGSPHMRLYDTSGASKVVFSSNGSSKIMGGNVGINEDDPQSALHINKLGSNSPILFNDGYYGYALGGGNLPSDVDPNSNSFRMYMSSTRLHMVTTHGSGQFRWLNGNSNRRMTLDNNGNLAIGLNVDPSQKLDIQGNSSSGTIIQIRDTGDDYPVGITYNHGVSGHHTAWYAGTMDGGSGERKFTIGTKVVDGFHNDLTTSSYSLLELNQQDNSATFRGPVDIRKSGSNTRHADTALLITNTNASSMTAQMQIMSGNAGYSNLYLGDTNSYSQGGLSYDHTNDDFNFRASNSIKMTLNSGGLSVTPNVDTTHVFGRVSLHSVSSDYATFSHYDQRSSGVGYALRQYTNGSTNLNSASGQKINFSVNNATKAVLSGDNFGIGTTSPSYKLDLVTGMRINRAGNDPYILLHRDGSGVAQIRGVSGGGINLTSGSSATSRLYINNSGDIGINHTSPSAMLDVAGSLKIQGNATFDQQVTHEDMVTFNSDVDFTNASIEGLSVSTSKILVLQSSAASSGQDVNDATRNIYWQSMSTENNTYVSWAAGSGGYYISFTQAGEYMVYVDLIVTDATANDRMNFFGWISHMNSSNSIQYSYPLGGTYIRDDSSLYDSGGIGGSARLIVSANDRVKVNTQRFDSQDSLDDNPLSTSLSRIRIEKINYNLNTG